MSGKEYCQHILANTFLIINRNDHAYLLIHFLHLSTILSNIFFSKNLI